MRQLLDLQPLNQEEEKQKFFKNYKYNPQFVYKRKFSNKELTAFGKPKKHLFDYAIKMAKNRVRGKDDFPYIKQETIKKTCNQLFQKLKIKPISIFFKNKYTAKVTLASDGLYFRTPLTYSQEQINGKLDHEIQTHLLRKTNNKQQPWSTTKRPDHLFRRTEEGLANLHTYINMPNKAMNKGFTNYIAAYKGFYHSFSETFLFLLDIGIKPERAWPITLRKKRGIEDTSQPGGYTKDITYLEGSIAVWNWIISPDNNPRDLYLGRIDISEISQLKPTAKKDNIILPTFLDNIDEYKKTINEIGIINQFDKLSI